MNVSFVVFYGKGVDEMASSKKGQINLPDEEQMPVWSLDLNASVPVTTDVEDWKIPMRRRQPKSRNR